MGEGMTVADRLRECGGDVIRVTNRGGRCERLLWRRYCWDTDTSLLCVAAVMDLLWELVAGPKDCAEGNAYLGLKDIRFMQVNG